MGTEILWLIKIDKSVNGDTEKYEAEKMRQLIWSMDKTILPLIHQSNMNLNNGTIFSQITAIFSV